MLKTQHSKNEDHGIWSHCSMANSWGNNGNLKDCFWRVPESLQMMTAAMKLKDACSLEEKLCVTNLDSILKSREIILLTKVHQVKAMVSPVVITDVRFGV